MNTDPDDTRAGAQAAAEIFGITYWIIHPDDDRSVTSAFQEFSPGILETAELFQRVAFMPFDVRELFGSREDVLLARQAGFSRTRVIPLRVSALGGLFRSKGRPFNVVVSAASVVADVADVLERSGSDWLHLSAGRDHRAAPVNEVGDQEFVDFFRRVARANNEPTYLAMFAEFMNEPPREWAKLSVDCPSYMHNLTRPNEIGLGALRVDLQGVQAMGPHAPNLYISGAVRSARAVAKIREQLTAKRGLQPHTNDLTVSVDSVGWGVSRAGIREKIIETGASRGDANLVRAIVERAGFTSEVRDADLRQQFGDAAQAILAVRSAELNAYTSALVLHSGLRLTPVLRLNPGLNELRPALIDIGNCARGNGPHRDFKISKLGRRLSERMTSIVDERALSAMRGSSTRMSEVAMIADLPLEWLRIDGVPLGVRHDVSRVPCNPGNLMFAQCVNNEISYISKDSLDEVLVVRSFRDDDPIAGHLEDALSQHAARLGITSPKIKFVDVTTPAEFVDAVSSFSGSMLIFDGHGTRNSRTGIGSIVVGGKPLDVWGLRSELTFPPIVLLSACDTYPIDGSHGSTAVGMLALGARTVLGTLLPIHSLRSCAFLARLVLRLSAFLPIAMSLYPHGVNWRFVMSGMLRMVYASEIAYSFAASARISPALRSSILYEANTDINSRNPKWLDRLHERLAHAAGVSVAKVRAYCDKYEWITDSMKYVQLGRPELIHVVNAAPADVWARVAEAGPSSAV